MPGGPNRGEVLCERGKTQLDLEARKACRERLLRHLRHRGRVVQAHAVVRPKWSQLGTQRARQRLAPATSQCIPQGHVQRTECHAGKTFQPEQPAAPLQEVVLAARVQCLPDHHSAESHHCSLESGQQLGQVRLGVGSAERTAIGGQVDQDQRKSLDAARCGSQRRRQRRQHGGSLDCGDLHAIGQSGIGGRDYRRGASCTTTWPGAVLSR